MRHVYVKRKWVRRSVLEHLGINADLERVFVGQLKDGAEASRIVNLPTDHRYWTPIQRPDGTPAFMYGHSPYGGSDPFTS